MNLRLERSGSFSVRGVDTSAQCGTPGLDVFTYTVEIVAPHEALDHQGFIIDNEAVHKYFVDQFHGVFTVPSCERMAIEACHGLMARVPRALGIKVSISGNPQAKITATLLGRPPKNPLSNAVARRDRARLQRLHDSRDDDE